MAQQTPPAGVGVFQDTVQVANIPCLLTAASTTDVFTVPAGKRFFLTSITIHDPTADVSSGTINVGSSGTTTTSFLSAQALTKLNAAGSLQMQVSTWATAAKVLAGGDVLRVVPQTAVTGETVQVDVVGYLM